MSRRGVVCSDIYVKAGATFLELSNIRRWTHFGKVVLISP